ncbi:MAG: penicillin-binding protein 1C [Bacteroidetes bacterium]|nr:penicillin-binding protein 1C [Bacteroidota bacterium]
MWKTIKRYTLYLTGISLLAFLVFLCFKPKSFTNPLSTAIYAENNALLSAIIASDGQWRIPANDSLPDKYKHCIIHFEDEHFFKHPGVNPFSIARAIYQNIKAKRVVSGGSTITMQTVRLMRRGQGRTILEKLIEALHAIRLEVYFSKEEILRMHSAYAPFGGNVVGLEAASWRYYGRDPFTLSWAESATLAVLPNAPSLIYPGKNAELLKNKRNRLLAKLAENEIISAQEAELSFLEELPSRPHALPQLTPHLMATAINQNQSGQRIQTSINYSLQERTQELVNQYQKRYAANLVFNAAIIVAKIETGEVLAYVGNSTNETAIKNGGHVDVIQAQRSTGSLLKPFLYAFSLQKGQILPNSLIDDIPVFYAGYAPQNYSHSYDGMVPASMALSRSLNVPSVVMLKEYGISPFMLDLKNLGMNSLNQPASHYGLSLILGGAEGSLWNLTGMYATLGRILKHYPNYGAKYFKSDIRPLSFQKHISKEPENELATPIISAGAIWHTINAMEEVNRPENEQGWKFFHSSKRIAWKTGTSYGYRDAWAIGINGDCVVGVWVGNADGKPREGLVGVRMAAPIMFDAFKLLPNSAWFIEPFEDETPIEVCKQSGQRKGQFCHEVDTIRVPNSSLKAMACTFHKKIQLNRELTHRVNSNCESIGHMVDSSWFTLPPVQGWYFGKKYGWYHTLPPFKVNCETGSEKQPMQFIYPNNFSKIKIPTELDGTKGAVVLKLAHNDHNAKVYWYLNQTMVDITKGTHQVDLTTEPGQYLLKVVDECGNVLTRNIEIVN